MNFLLFRYFGGKYKLLKSVKGFVENSGCNIYCEVFVGGLVLLIELLLSEVVKKIIINDFDYIIYCFWYSILYYIEDFINFIKFIIIDIDIWYI